MSAATVITYFFFWVPVLALMLVSGVMVWRRLFSKLPFFFAYVTSAWLIGGLRFAAFHLNGKVYLYVYWISELAGAVLVSLALYEVFLRRLFAGFRTVRAFRALFPVAAVVVLLLAIITALQAPDKNAAFQMVSRAFDFVRTAVLVFFVALMALLGRNWTRHDLGIALGFALQATAALVAAAVRTTKHYKPGILDTLEIVAYNLSCIIWLVALIKPDEVRRHAEQPEFKVAHLTEARSWETVLKNWFRSKKGIF